MRTRSIQRPKGLTKESLRKTLRAILFIKRKAQITKVLQETSIIIPTRRPLRQLTEIGFRLKQELGRGRDRMRRRRMTSQLLVSRTTTLLRTQNFAMKSWINSIYFRSLMSIPISQSPTSLESVISRSLWLSPCSAHFDSAKSAKTPRKWMYLWIRIQR